MPTIENEIKKLKLRDFENFNLGQLFFFLSEHDRISYLSNKVPLINIILRLFLETDKWVYESGSGKILFFLQNSTRKDVISLTHSVANLVDERDILYLKKSRWFHLDRSIKYAQLVLSWKKSLQSTDLTFSQKIKVLNLLLKMKKLMQRLDKIEYNGFNLLVNFYDAEPMGNLMAQVFKKNNCTTATLSHGLVLAERDSSIIDYAGIELKGFISNYFLAWNNFTKNEAKKQGIDISKILILGIPKFIEYNREKREIKAAVLGLILDNHSGDLFNRSLIRIANDFCKKNDYLYTIRFHPSFAGSEYDELIDDENYIGMNISSSITEYCESVEFSIIVNSTVFIELVYLKHKVYRYGTKDKFDKYKDFNYNTFCDVSQLQEMFVANVDESEELFDEICTIENVKNSYQTFFKKYKN